MSLRYRVFLIAFSALPLGASVIDVTAQTSVLLHLGDELRFEIDSIGYNSIAGLYGAPPLPERVEFVMDNAPDMGAGRFIAWMESATGQLEVRFATLWQIPASFHGSQYTGPITVLTSALDVAGQDSAALFGERRAFLVLQNRNPDITLGLPPYTLSQDMKVTLSGGPLAIGARVQSVTLLSGVAPTPEPGSAWLLLCGAGLFLLSAILRRAS